jgi:hypothetical protein
MPHCHGAPVPSLRNLLPRIDRQTALPWAKDILAACVLLLFMAGSFVAAEILSAL